MTELKLDQVKQIAGGGGSCGRDKGGCAPAPAPAPQPKSSCGSCCS